MCNPARMDVGSATRVKKGMIDSTAIADLMAYTMDKLLEVCHICPLAGDCGLLAVVSRARAMCTEMGM